MRKVLLVLGSIVFCFCLSIVGQVRAQEAASSDSGQEVSSDVQQKEASGTDWKQELGAEKQQIQEQNQEMSQNAQAARAEKGQLREQIKAAMDSGDTQTAGKLKEQLRAVHKANMQQKMQDTQAMQGIKQDLKSDVKEARQEGDLPPRKDLDNNPPGPKGGPGTNWENKPGPQGGPGAGPDRKPGFD